MAKITADLLTDELDAKLAQLSDPTAALSRGLGAVGRVLVARVNLGFRGGVSPWGAPWAPLQSREGQPLRDTRRLQGSITSRQGEDGGVPFVEVGTNVDYAAFHQFGAGTIKEHVRLIAKAFGKPLKFPVWATIPEHDAKVPARPYLPIKGDEVDLPEAWADAARKALIATLERELEQ